MVWVDFTDEGESAARTLLEPFDVHPLVIEDMSSHLHRPKVDDYGAYLYLVMHSARWDESRPKLREIDFLLGKSFLVTFHDGAPRAIAATQAVLVRRPTLLSAGPATLLHFVLDTLVDHYMPIMDRIANQIDRIEEGILDERGMQPAQEITRLKRGMSELRRIVGPQRDTVLALTRDEFRVIPSELRPYLRDVYDRMARVNDLLDSFRDEIATLLELQITNTSNRLNRVIKRLTVLATIGLPLTMITSYYGMNFPFVEYQWKYAWAFVLGLLALAGIGTWWYLKKQDSL
jgi:magnesium transporter